MWRFHLLRHSWLFLAVLLAMTAGIAGGVLYPAWKTIRETHHDIMAMRAHLEEKYERTRQYRKSVRSLSSLREDAARLASLFPARGEAIALITALEDIADAHHLEMTLDLGSAEEKRESAGVMTALPFRIIMRGTLENTMHAIRNLEQGKFLITMHDFAFARETGAGSTTSTMLTTISARAYLR